MTRKIKILSVTLALMCAFVLTVSAETVESGTVSSTALNYFTGIVNKLPTNSDYVIYRTGDYTSAMVYGFDFNLTGNVISASDCTKVVYDTRSGYGTSYVPTVTTSELSTFSLTTSSSSIIYSSVGSWASVGDNKRDTVDYILWSLVFLIMLFCIFKFVRYRRSYINL